MAFLKFLLYVVIFFAISTITQMVYSGLKKSYSFESDWIAPLFSVITIMFWMIIPSHWFVLLLFAITLGITAQDKGKNTKRKLF
ncbi:hypothetical protein [Tepidibacillus fermentans]|uniref:Uncharacterized protein n=1 Tax=Tepidibacillus fermentans TaxID=1281767 RepID=A0A4R3KIB4_9BACI|nr:hypothetical protein [Tepidibacillus fermentans]TCS83296.1 hypothetical protein EDD72_10536 [Tepidibacillus fermentans]